MGANFALLHGRQCGLEGWANLNSQLISPKTKMSTLAFGSHMLLSLCIHIMNIILPSD